MRNSTKHHINMEEEQEQNIWILWKGNKVEKNQTRGVRNSKQSPHEMVTEFTQRKHSRELSVA